MNGGAVREERSPLNDAIDYCYEALSVSFDGIPAYDGKSDEILP